VGTLGTAKVSPYPGTVRGTIQEAIEEVDALIATLRAQPSPNAITDPWEIMAYLQAVEEQPLDTEP
jgi:hypothetical protein